MTFKWIIIFEIKEEFLSFSEEVFQLVPNLSYPSATGGVYVAQ